MNWESCEGAVTGCLQTEVPVIHPLLLMKMGNEAIEELQPATHVFLSL